MRKVKLYLRFFWPVVVLLFVSIAFVIFLPKNTDSFTIGLISTALGVGLSIAAAATVICWNAGQQGYMLLAGTCQSMVTVCAAQAYYANPRKWAGITFSPGGSWCWKY